MSRPPHLEPFVYNNDHYNGPELFTCFPLLPKELRLQIWRYILPRQRLIRIWLDQEPKATPGRAEQVSKDAKYYAAVDGYQVIPKFFRIDSESREEALRFYRVRIPCLLKRKDGDKQLSPGILYFNPEYDFLWFNVIWDCSKPIVEFLLYLKFELDPRKIGIRNLAVDSRTINSFYCIKLDDRDPEVAASFRELIAQLHEIFLMEPSRIGRHNFAEHSGYSFPGHKFNRAFPTMARALVFERLSRDPRPVSEYLKQIYVNGNGPEHIRECWGDGLRRTWISTPDVQYRYLLSFAPFGDIQDFSMGESDITDFESARTWLDKEDEIRRKEPDDTVRNEDLEGAVRSVFGFWLFPIRSEIQCLDEHHEEVRNMTDCWPELGLSTLA